MKFRNSKFYIIQNNNTFGGAICKDYVGDLLEFIIQFTLWVYPIYQPLRSGRIWHKVNF